MKNLIAYLFLIFNFCESIAGCECPTWMINFTKRRYFCGREFRGLAPGCKENSIYQCSQSGGTWTGEETSECGVTRRYRRWPYCELNCHGASNADKCDTLCVSDKGHADASFNHLYEHSNQRPWLDARRRKPSKKGNVVKNGHKVTKPAKRPKAHKNSDDE